MDMDSPDPVHDLNIRIHDLQSQLAHLQAERTTLEQDLIDYRTDLLNTRTELYAEMLNSARHQQRSFDHFRTIQKLEARHQRFCSLLVDIGIPRTAVDVVCQVIQSGNGSADDILVDAIEDASNDPNTLLSRIKPIVVTERTPEHYQSALNLTLNVRRELKSQRKRSKFWKKLAQEDGTRANTITPSPSDISSIRQDLTPERQGALNALMARRRAARYPDNDADVFGGHGRISALDTLVTSLTSRPRFDNTGLSSSLSSSTASSSSTSYLSYHSGLSRIYRDSIAETPTVPSRFPSSLSNSLRRSSRRSSSQSIVLGSINLNVSRISSNGPLDPTLIEGAEENRPPEAVPASTVTRSQDLLQNSGGASQVGHGHRRVPSTTSRRSGRLTSGSFRLSTSSLSAAQLISQGLASNHDVIHAVRMPNMHLIDLVPISDTPMSSQSMRTLFSDTLATPTETHFSPTNTPMESTPLDANACHPCPHTCFLDHLDVSISSASLCVSACGSMSTSTSTSTSTSASDHDHDHDEEEEPHTIPLGESKDSLFTSSSITSTSSTSASDTGASAPDTPTTPLTPPTPPTPPTTGKGSGGRSMLPVLAKHLRRLSFSSGSVGPGSSERLVDRLRGLRGGSRSRSPQWGGSTTTSGSESESTSADGSPVKGSGIPVLRRRKTIRARRMSVMKI